MNRDLILVGLNKAFEHVSAGTSLDRAAADVIAAVRAGLPKSVDLGFVPGAMAQAVEELEEQLRALFEREPPDDDVNGLMFGMFDRVVTEKPRKLTCQVYVCGSNRFNPNDPDWATGPTWWPKHRYLSCGLIDRLSAARPGKPSGIDGFVDEAVIEPLLMLVLGEVVTRIGGTVLLGNVEARGVGIGFDSGDPHTLGVLEPDGFAMIETLDGDWEGLVAEDGEESDEDEDEEFGEGDWDGDDEEDDEDAGEGMNGKKKT